MQIITLILTLLITTVPPQIVCWDYGEDDQAATSLCDQEFNRAYILATEWVYPANAYIGKLLPKKEHNCDSWLPAYWNPGMVAVRPLYHDSGLPLYDIFEDQWEELVGFEFRSWVHIVRTCKLITKTTWHCWEDDRELWRGYSIALTEREKFIYAILE